MKIHSSILLHYLLIEPTPFRTERTNTAYNAMNQLPFQQNAQTTFLDGYCSTVQGLLDWFEVDLGFTELSS